MSDLKITKSNLKNNQVKNGLNRVLSLKYLVAVAIATTVIAGGIYISFPNSNAAKAVLKSYLEAKSWEERLKYVKKPDAVRPLMKEWYKESDLSNGKSFLRLEIHDNVRSQDLKIGNWIEIRAIFDERKNAFGVLVQDDARYVLQLTNTGFKIDWEASVEYNPMTFKAMKAQKPVITQKFRVYAELADYYNFEFSDSRNLYSVRFHEPNSHGFEWIYGYIKKDSVDGKKIFEILKDGEKHAMILRLRYPQFSRDSGQVLIDQFVQEYFNEQDSDTSAPSILTSRNEDIDTSLTTDDVSENENQAKYIEIIKDFEKNENTCRLDDGGGCNSLGYAYQLGIGTTVDKEKALEFFQKSCRLDNGLGCSELGYAYQQGIGTNVDREKAYEFYQKSCRLDNGLGCNNLGVAFNVGIGTTVDKEKAYEFFQKSCRLDDGLGCSNLGGAFRDGIGTTLDKEKAFEFYQKSCRLDNGLGCSNLGIAFKNGIGTSIDKEKAFEYFEKSCRLDDGWGCNSLGYVYQHGIGTSINKNKAFEYFEKSCRLDDGWGCSNLSAAYRDGIGVSTDLAKADEYIKKGCKIGWEGDEEYCKNNQTNFIPQLDSGPSVTSIQKSVSENIVTSVSADEVRGIENRIKHIGSSSSFKFDVKLISEGNIKTKKFKLVEVKYTFPEAPHPRQCTYVLYHHDLEAGMLTDMIIGLSDYMKGECRMDQDCFGCGDKSFYQKIVEMGYTGRIK